MNKRVYDIRIKILRTAAEHMTSFDLIELCDCAKIHGDAADRLLIDAAMTLLDSLKRSHQP